MRRPWRFFFPRLMSSVRSHAFNPGAGLRPLGYVRLAQLKQEPLLCARLLHATSLALPWCISTFFIV